MKATNALPGGFSAGQWGIDKKRRRVSSALRWRALGQGCLAAALRDRGIARPQPKLHDNAGRELALKKSSHRSYGYLQLMNAVPRARKVSLAAVLLLWLCAGSGAQTLPASPEPQTKTAPAPIAQATAARSRKLAAQLDVSAIQGWTDTGVDLLAGDKVTCEASGTLQSLAGGAFGPDGLARTWADVLEALPVKDAGRGALIGRLGDNDYAVPFLLGSRKEFVASRAGRLFLGVNDPGNSNLQGNLRVGLKIVPAAPRSETARDCNFPLELLTQVPRRVSDAGGREGDMVNFILVGSEEAVLRAFADAGWVQVDRTIELAVLHAALGTLDKKAYTELPISELFAYGRAQDFGFAHAEPVRVVMTRHHLRIWKAPFELGAAPVWIGAATHDIGFEEDQRNGGVTHKIDPNVDDERTFVEQTLSHTGNIAAQTYVVPANPVREARTATGGTFSSDGRILVLVLR